MSQLQIERREGIPVALLPGDLDSANAARVRDDLVCLVGNEVFDLVLDFGATTYVDSAGLDMLFRLATRLSQRRATLRLVIARSSQLVRLAQIVGLPAAMPVHATLEEALAQIAASSPPAEGAAGTPQAVED